MHIALQVAFLHATVQVSIPLLVGAATIACLEVDTTPVLLGAATVAPTMRSA